MDWKALCVMALFLSTVVLVTLGAADHTDEGLLNERQESQLLIDEPGDTADSGSPGADQADRRSTDRGRTATAT